MKSHTTNSHDAHGRHQVEGRIVAVWTAGSKSKLREEYLIEITEK